MSDKEYLKRLGAKISALRKEKGITQVELAKKLKTQHPMIGRVEKGVNCTINTLRKIAKVLGVSVSELVRV